MQISLIPRCCLFSSTGQWKLHLAELPHYLGWSCSDLQDKHTQTSSCESCTNYCTLSKAHWSHCFAKKNSGGILFCKFKSCKSSQISWNKGGFISFSNKGNALSVLFSQHEQVADLLFLFCQKYGDRNNPWPGQACEEAAFAAILQLSLKRSSKMSSQFNIRYESQSNVKKNR